MWRACLLIALVLLEIGTARADERGYAGERVHAAEQVRAAQAHWRDLDYELVVKAADSAISARDATMEERIEALVLKGSAQVVLGQEAAAVVTFEQLFAIDPDHELPPSTSPRILSVYRPAQAAWQVKQEERLATELGTAMTALQLNVQWPARARGGQPVEVEVKLVDPAHIADQVVLSYRRQGSVHYSTITSSGRGLLKLTIPGPLTASDRAYVLELHVRARHRSGVTLRREGTPDQPRLVRVAAGSVPGPPPITRRWWFWAGAGTLAVTAVAVPLLVDRAVDVGEQRLVVRAP